jgi:D-3-phosphoglycerate dehydrogenase / 2-oxoglutarate reductase
MAPRVLVSDKLSETAVQVFRDRGIGVDYLPDLGKDKEALLAAIPAYDGLAIRSATKVTPKIIAAAANLKVIGRAGIGVDNVDIPAASARGIIVMNTPYGNAITTAEHTLAMMMALARQIPEATSSTRAGKWEKNRFMGVELFNKTLGVIGCGNIGGIVADRALGLKMKVIAYDPFLSEERAVALGVEKVELEPLFQRADFITLHAPLTERTRNLVSRATLSRMKKGVRIVNCARGGLVDEEALYDALVSKHVAGAALDVFEVEPAIEHKLFALDNVVCTPHLGASTMEAQENVAIQVAEQMADYLAKGAVQNALNMPSISAEEAPRLKPFIALAEKLGLFAGQLTEDSIRGVTIEYAGDVGDMNMRALTSAALSGLMKPQLGDINMVSAPVLAKERGIKVDETRQTQRGAYETYIRITVRNEKLERSVAGTVFSDGKARIIQIKGIELESDFGSHMLYVTNRDKPGFIGALGMLLGNAGINIASFHLGRSAPGEDAICLVQMDEALPADVLAAVAALPQVKQARRLAF